MARRGLAVMRAAELRDAGDALMQMSDHERAAALAQAARILEDPTSVEGAELRNALRQSTQLSGPMIEWGLSTTLATVQSDALVELLQLQRPAGAIPRRLAAVVLAGNVFTASVRGLLLPLLAGVPVIAKASSSDDALPRLLQRALMRADTRIGSALQVLRFGRDDLESTKAMLADADVVSVYGDDDTVRELGARASPGAVLLAHGHGLSALYVPKAALHTQARAEQTASAAALDVAAYDQRGCLSPHFVLVERDSAVDAETFAKLLSERSLPALGQLLPRGPLDARDKAECLQWCGVAALRGTVLQGASHCVSFEGEHALRPSPGARHVGVYVCDGLQGLAAKLAPFGEHLKCVGVAGDRLARAQVSAVLPNARPPRVCRAGEMQTPLMASDADGRPALDGLFTRG